MSEISDRYRRVADGFAARLKGTTPAILDQPSPCEGWTGRDVASHVVHTHRRVMALLDGGDAETPEAGGDLAAAFRDVSAAVQAVLDDPARATKIVGGTFGEQPFEQLVGRLLSTDTLIHTWDLSRATGQEERLDADAVVQAHEFLTGIGDGIRRPGGFGPKIEPRAGADAQTALLAFAGRRA